MHTKEFIWLVPGDDNRVADGYALRGEFLGGRHHAFPFGVSALEVLVALSRRVAFQLDEEPEWWAWKLVENLGLDRFEGLEFTAGVTKRIDDILTRLIERQYKPNGEGGFFPMDNPKEDQTKLEIWHQMSAYVIIIMGL